MTRLTGKVGDPTVRKAEVLRREVADLTRALLNAAVRPAVPSQPSSPQEAQ